MYECFTYIHCLKHKLRIFYKWKNEIKYVLRKSQGYPKVDTFVTSTQNTRHSGPSSSISFQREINNSLSKRDCVNVSPAVSLRMG